MGLATAREAAMRYPEMKIAVVEKEEDVGKNIITKPYPGLHSTFDISFTVWFNTTL